MGFIRSERTVSAVFESERRAAEALEDLRGVHLHGAHLEELPPGRYLLEDELTPERSLRGRLAIAGWSLLGGLAGIVIVGVATSMEAGLGGYIAGFLSGSLFGFVVGGVAASVFMLPDDDDEDRWLPLASEQHLFAVVGTADAPHDVRVARSVLAGHHPVGFLSAEVRRAA